MERNLAIEYRARKWREDQVREITMEIEARIAENGYGCNDPNDPITRAQIESAYH